MRVRAAIAVVSIVAMLVGPVLFAAEPIQIRTVPCVSAAQNPRVVASLPPNTKTGRVFFKAAGQASEYYVYMRRGENGNWWVFLPMPDSKTSAIVYRVVSTDDTRMQASSPALTTTVAPACAPQTLTADEERFAQNLVVGLTTTSQSPVPTGFQCRGVVSYIAANGDLKPNDECRRVLAAAAGAGAATGAAAGAAGMSTATVAALAAVGVAAAGYAVYESNKSTTKASPSKP